MPMERYSSVTPIALELLRQGIATLVTQVSSLTNQPNCVSKENQVMLVEEGSPAAMVQTYTRVSRRAWYLQGKKRPRLPEVVMSI